jgi:hypothetical protein
MDNVQKTRLIDVFVLAPFMVYAGSMKSNLPNIIRGGLIFFGITTLIYNGTNYIKNIK